MKILVTGGAGYIGSTLVLHLLSQGHEVTAYDNLLHPGDSLLSAWSHPHFHFVRGDVRDDELLDSLLPDQEGVVHLAAIVGDPACAASPNAAKAVNLDASLRLLDLCKSNGIVRFVFASTCSNYGKMADSDGLVDETSELRPVSLYAETKVAVEQAILGRDSGGPVSTVLRFATIFGVSPRMRFDLTINQFVFEMMMEKKLEVFGESFWRPYIHVRDAARAISTVLASEESTIGKNVFNVGNTDQNYQKKQLVELIKPFAPSAVVHFVHKKEDPRDYRVSFEKVGRLLRFNTSISVQQGILELSQLADSGIIENFRDKRYSN